MRDARAPKRRANLARAAHLAAAFPDVFWEPPGAMKTGEEENQGVGGPSPLFLPTRNCGFSLKPTKKEVPRKDAPPGVTLLRDPGLGDNPTH